MPDDPNQWSTYRLSDTPDPESDKPAEGPLEASAEADLTPSWRTSSAETEPGQTPAQSDPKFLGMAVSAARSMAKFAASGFRPVAKQIHMARIAQCNVCQYRDGSRCMLCGCFADKKAWIPHEDCPIGRWPG